MKKIILFIFVLLGLNHLTLNAAEGSVVCIHGFIRSYRCMIPMGNMLDNEGFEVYLWDYQSRKNTIQGHAENLVKLLNTIAQQKPGQPIHFVTHSLGGIIIKTALNHPNCPEEARVGKAVLLAPPSQGSAVARSISHITPIRWFFGKKAGHQLLTYTSDDMENLGYFPEDMDVMVISGIKGNYLLFRTPNDGKVFLHETRLSTPHTHLILNVSHSWIMTSRESMDLTRKFLLH
ncbi:MAG: alpha/beta fold hydrolase [Verrucomicrobia bacterium]|nr:alpha/beta fold hydrolase [Verrucomicrobiota bacterium]MBS0646909.1 alpha/beta fold hydrolase [Verrucomicrobiota bacterium]